MTASPTPPAAGPMRDAPPRRTEDPGHMREALELAEHGWGRVAPNPLVGAVVARGAEVVGRGWHAEFGGDHAEVAALRDAGPDAEGATLYVTLEPCAHEGKTPPCTEAILRAGVRRVVIACRDPNRESGDGAAALRAAGLDVEVGLEGRRAKRLNAAFLWSRRTGAPFVALKLALSLDARLGRRGARSAVSGPAAWARVHRWRAGHDAVLVGRRTVEVDDPLLTARGEPAPRRPPVRAVLDSDLRVSPDSQLARTVDAAPVWIFTAPDALDAPDSLRRRAALEDAGVEVIDVPRRGEHELELDAVWGVLAERGIASVLVEGGGRLGGSLLRARKLQRLHLIFAPLLFGPGGVPAFPDGPLAERGEWTPVEREAVGPDTLLVLDHAALDETLADI